MSQETIIFALLLVPSLIIAIVFHEVAHGWVANALGDSTAKDKGRLTLNPFRHVDPVGTLLVPGGLALVGRVLVKAEGGRSDQQACDDGHRQRLGRVARGGASRCGTLSIV